MDLKTYCVFSMLPPFTTSDQEEKFDCIVPCWAGLPPDSYTAEISPRISVYESAIYYVFR